ncbi:MAG: YihY/virulence factor BrkB family protein, partial [Paracoccaceae bacterium]
PPCSRNMPERALRLGWIRFLREVMRRYSADQSSVLAGYIAYAAMLAGFPFPIFTITLAGTIIGERYSVEAVELMFDTLPGRVAQTLEPVLHEVIGVERGGVLTLALAGTIYGASNGVEAVRIGLDRAYDVEKPRSFLVNRLVSMAFVLLGFVVFGCLAVLIIFAPLVFQLVESLTDIRIPAGTDIARYAVGAVMLYCLFWLMHRILPAREMHGIRLWPGIVTSIAVWVAAASALSLYLAHAPSYALTYGTLAGVIVTLLFFYLTGTAIILGAQVNAVLHFDLPEE